MFLKMGLFTSSSLRAGKTQGPITLKMEVICSSKYRFFLEPYGIISQKIFSIVLHFEHDLPIESSGQS
jgi:hypothetical protein